MARRLAPRAERGPRLSTASFAELYYRLAGQVTTAGTVPLDSLSAGFFSQVGVDASTTPAAAATALQAAGDQMLQAVIFHSDNLELSEQFATPPPGTRRASATCPGATPHSCPPSAPGPPSERSPLMSGARPLMMVCRPKS